MGGLDEFAQNRKNPLCFIVTNVARDRKTICLFHVPLMFGESYDYIQMGGIGEVDIKTSLLKGELMFKIRAGEIVIQCSDLDLITFNSSHRAFLVAAGVTKGLDAGGSGGGVNYLLKYNVPMIRLDQRLFKLPEQFYSGLIDDNYFRPMIFHNGVLKYENIDFVLEKSSIFLPANLYDRIKFISFTPNVHSSLFATYSTPK